MKLTLHSPCIVRHIGDTVEIECSDSVRDAVAENIFGGARLSIAQVCERYAVDQSTVHRWFKAGLRYVKLGGVTRVREADLMDFEKSQTRASKRVTVGKLSPGPSSSNLEPPQNPAPCGSAPATI